MALTHRVIPAGEIIVGDCFVSDEWHDSALWGQTVTSVQLIEDALSTANGRLVSLRFTGHCGLVTREHNLNEVLRAEELA
jgi:hypothetical protein